LRLAALAVLAVAGLAVDGWALAGGNEKIERGEIIIRDDDGQVHVFKSGDGDGPFEIATFGDSEEGGAYLGVSTREETKLSDGGARVTRVFPDTPAAKAGLKEGDVIVGADGKPVRGPAMLTEKIHAAKPGDRVNLEIVREGKRSVVTAELEERKGMRIVIPRSDTEAWGEMPPEERARMEAEIERAHEEARRALENLRIEIPDMQDELRELKWNALSLGWGRPKLGVELVDTTQELREHLGGRSDAGVLVGKVLEDSAAEKAGIRVGDLLVSVAGEPVESPGDVIGAVSEKAGETIDVEVVRDGRLLKLTATLPEEERPDRPRRPRAVVPVPPPPPVPPVAPVAAPPPPAPPGDRRMV
jgi:predicted metalloprotease with PDZ domain